jgi:hypothetical protein
MAMHVKPHIVVHINPIGAMDRNAAPVGTTAEGEKNKDRGEMGRMIVSHIDACTIGAALPQFAQET